MSAPLPAEEREALGYDAAWLEAGILERSLLAEQHERLLYGGTRKTASYRSQTVSAWCAALEEENDMRHFIDVGHLTKGRWPVNPPQSNADQPRYP